MNMKTLKFLENLVSLVLSGEKTSTWRLFDDKDLQVGDELSFIDKKTGKEFATAKIIAVREKSLGKIDDSDFAGHEKFANKEEMLETYKKYYGDKVDWDTIVRIIEFQISKGL